MRVSTRWLSTAVAVLAFFCGSLAHAALVFPYVVDFETDDNGVALVNGQGIEDDDVEFFTLFTINSDGVAPVPNADAGYHLGPAIFDTDPNGPNAGVPGGDPDLLVDTGNALILQRSNGPNHSIDGTGGRVFNKPNDEEDSDDLGFIEFDFTTRVELESINLIDINGGVTAQVTMTDANGLTRGYFVPEKWTNDVTVEMLGYGTLLLNQLTPQDSEGDGVDGIPGNTDDFTLAIEEPGFDPAQVISLLIEFDGSAAIDNLVIVAVPEPSAAMLVAVAGIAVRGRRRV